MILYTVYIYIYISIFLYDSYMHCRASQHPNQPELYINIVLGGFHSQGGSPIMDGLLCGNKKTNYIWMI